MRSQKGPLKSNGEKELEEDALTQALVFAQRKLSEKKLRVLRKHFV